MKIAFVNPQRTILGNGPVRAGTPLGLLSLAGMVRRHLPETEVRFIDAVAEGAEREKIKEGVFRFGLASNELKDRLTKMGIGEGDIVAISSIFTSEWKNAALCAEVAKELGAKVVLGGHHATYQAEFMLENTAADYIVLGEGELPFIELIDAISKQRTSVKELRKIGGIAFASDKGVTVNTVFSKILSPFVLSGSATSDVVVTGAGRRAKNLDELPDPAFDLLNPALYRPEFSHWGKTPEGSKAIIDYSISRGCPMGCNFCTSTAMWGRKIRTFSPERIRKQLRRIKEIGFDNLAVEDDQVLLLPKTEQETLFAELGRLNFRWVIDAGLYYPLITEGFIREIAENGCYRVFLPIEHPLVEISHGEGKYRNLKKQSEVKEFLSNTLKMLKGYGIESYVGMMVGFMQETQKTLDAVLEYAKLVKESGTSGVVFSYIKPLPGTKYSKRYISMGGRSWGLSPELWTFSTPVIEPRELSIETLRERIDEISLQVNGRANSLINSEWDFGK